MELNVFMTTGARRRHMRWLSATLLLLWGCGACAPDTVTIKSYPQFASQAIAKVAIAPFRAVKRERGTSLAFRTSPPADLEHPQIPQSLGSVSGSSVPGRSRLIQVSVPDSVPDMIQHMAYSQLRLKPRIQVIPPETVGQILGSQEGSARAQDRQETARLLGQRLAVDAVLEGVIRVYREREGTKFAALPAAVGFEFRLLDARDGRVLWVGDYFEEQKPMTHDFKGFLERGGTFVTAEELARAGVARVLQSLPLGTD